MNLPRVARLAPGEYLILAHAREDMPAVMTPEIVRTLMPNLTRIVLQPEEQKTVRVEFNR